MKIGFGETRLDKVEPGDIVDGVLNIPWGVSKIGEKACCHNSDLETLIIPPTIRFIGEQAFWKCPSLKEVIFDVGKQPELPKKINAVLMPQGDPAVISSGAFLDCTHLRTVRFRDRVQSVGKEAFCGCHRLSTLIVDGNLETIGERSFADCSSLEELDFPSGLKTVGEHAFQDCDRLERIGFERGLNSIERKAFSGCNSLADVELPISLKKIGDGAFSGCQSLESIEIKKGIISMGVEAFSLCPNLRSVVIPGIKRIPEGAFRNCSSLQYVYLGGTNKEIGEKAFKNCASLEKIRFTSDLETIEDYAFEGCKNLSDVKFPKTLKYIGKYSFSKCEKLSTLDLSRGVETVNCKAFEKCRSLRDVRLPDNLEGIGRRIFDDCSNIVQSTWKGDTQNLYSSDGQCYALVKSEFFSWGSVSQYVSFPDEEKIMYRVFVGTSEACGTSAKDAALAAMYGKNKKQPLSDIVWRIHENGYMDAMDYWLLTDCSLEDIKQLMEDNNLDWDSKFTVSQGVDYAKGRWDFAKFAKYAEEILVSEKLKKKAS